MNRYDENSSYWQGQPMHRYFRLKPWLLGLLMALWLTVAQTHAFPALLLRTPAVPHPGLLLALASFPLVGLLLAARAHSKWGRFSAGDFWNLKRWYEAAIANTNSVVMGFLSYCLIAWLAKGDRGSLLAAVNAALLCGCLCWYQYCLSQMALAPWLRHRIRSR